MKNTRLYDLCKRSLPDYINVWKQLVNVDCGSRNGKGINAVADVLIREFEKISPYSIEKIPMENPEEGCHLLVVFRGKGKGKIMPILIRSFPKEQLPKGRLTLRETGQRALVWQIARAGPI